MEPGSDLLIIVACLVVFLIGVGGWIVFLESRSETSGKTNRFSTAGMNPATWGTPESKRYADAARLLPACLGIAGSQLHASTPPDRIAAHAWSLAFAAVDRGREIHREIVARERERASREDELNRGYNPPLVHDVVRPPPPPAPPPKMDHVQRLKITYPL